VGGSLYHMPVSTLPFSSLYFDMAERIDYLDHVGIEKQLLSLPGLLGVDYLPLDQSLPMVKASNDGIALACAKYSDRIFGLVALPLGSNDAMLDELKRCVEDFGFIGEILANNSFLSLDHTNQLKPLFKYANKKKLHFFINLSNLNRHTGNKNRSDYYKRLAKKYQSKNPYFRYVQAQISLERMQYKNALNHIKNAINKKEDEARFYKLQSEIHTLLGNRREASKAIRSADNIGAGTL
jgi:hypothetical protein